MRDKAHLQTDDLLLCLEHELSTIYAVAARKIKKQTAPLLDEMYLEDEDATQKQRLDYADKNGKDEAVKKTTKIITAANEQAVNLINRRQMENYKLNFTYACDDIIRQIRRSIKKGGE